MQRRVSRDDLRQVAELREHLEQGGLWAVADDYELRKGEIIAKPPSRGGLSSWQWYRPLEKYPDLFLRFVTLADNDDEDFERAALEWARKYGLPGEVGYKIFEGDPGVPPGFPDRMLVSDFRREVRQARRTLHLYVAVMNRDENAALNLMPPDRADNVLEQAMTLAKDVVNGMVGDCKPQLLPTHPHSLEVKSTWAFDTLLGAMYLQMYWLMALGGNVARCEYENCGMVLSLARPHPEGRKPRQDKRFCNEACRQAHHRSKSKS